MRIYIEIKEPRNQYDTFGKRLKGPIKPLTPFESIDKAIKWLEFFKSRQSQGLEESRQ